MFSRDNNDEREISEDLLDSDMTSVPIVCLQIGVTLDNLHPPEEEELIDTESTGSLDSLRGGKSLTFKM